MNKEEFLEDVKRIVDERDDPNSECGEILPELREFDAGLAAKAENIITSIRDFVDYIAIRAEKNLP